MKLILMEIGQKTTQKTTKIDSYINAPIGTDGTSSGWLEISPGELGDDWQTFDFDVGKKQFLLIHLVQPRGPDQKSHG